MGTFRPSAYRSGGGAAFESADLVVEATRPRPPDEVLAGGGALATMRTCQEATTEASQWHCVHLDT